MVAQTGFLNIGPIYGRPNEKEQAHGLLFGVV